MLFQKRIKLSLKRVDKFSNSILKKVKSLNIGDKILFDIRLSLEEALINAVKHGNKADKNKKVLVEVDIDRNRLYIKVEDEGAGFNVESISPSIDEENVGKLSGRGVFLIKQCMDRVEFSRDGRQVVMVKYLTREKD